MHTSPDRDARLLPWIDATGPLMHEVTDNHDGTYTHVFTPTYSRVAQTRQRPTIVYRGDGGSSPSPGAEMQGYDRLMACLMHSDDVRCEVCGDDA